MSDQIPPTLSRATPKRQPLWLTLLMGGILLGILALLAYSITHRQRAVVQAGDTAPDFTLQPFDGSPVSLSGLSGKIVVVNFWASWCQPCQQETAWLEQAWKQYGSDGQVVFLGVDYMDTETAAKAFIKQYGMTYLNGPDLESKISHDYGVMAVPETYIIGRDGKLAYAQIGPFASLDQITGVIDALLKQ
ncbi:MAG TPA: TlpA disulfide reductase family protein [Longilinea sp.]|nr:TlpA disulfide reductase family protein [Longilinea sp.]